MRERDGLRSGDLWTPNTLGSSKMGAVAEMSGKKRCFLRC